MRQSCLDRSAGRAFTLVELLIVIGIIVLLVGILVPVVQSALVRAQVVRAASIVQNLGAACESYKTKTGYYPGQQYIRSVGVYTGGGDDVYTGSQYLARALFVQGAAWAPSFSAESVFETTATNGSVQLHDSITDEFSDPMAVLYFPARLGVKGTNQYDLDDNIQYLSSDNVEGDKNQAFTAFIRDIRPGGPGVWSPDKFVITAAGEDRKYFTDDDLTYPNRPK